MRDLLSFPLVVYSILAGSFGSIASFRVESLDSADRRGLLQGSEGRLTTKCYGHNISDENDESQDAPSRVEMGNPNSDVQML